MLLLLSGCLVNKELYDRRAAELADADGDGFAMQDECDDADASVFPGAAEVCDGLDQDCDGAIDEDATDVCAWYEDRDADGHGTEGTEAWACAAPVGFVASDDDCDDDDADVHPDAEDAWYDGIDANCDGADDLDADGDGDRWDEAGGTDCDDEDASVSGTAAEGWTDAGVDNDCDGSIEDQALAELGDLGARIDGADAGGAFGQSLAVLPAGWADEQPVLLVSAPFALSGAVYGWRADALSGAPSLAAADWQRDGDATGDYFGYGLGWAGDAGAPVVLIGSEGADGMRGRADVWVGADLSDDPTYTIAGDIEGAFFGSQVLSGYDHDGDGVSDALVTAILDSRVATNAGAAFLFLDPAGLAGEVPVSEADVVFTTAYAGALLAVSDVGDVDGDGIDDLGFDLDILYEDGPGGLLVPGGLASASYDVEDASLAQIYAAGNAYGQVSDWDGDGVGELLVASGGGLERYTLPITGTVTPWDNAASSLSFSAEADTVAGLRTDLDGYGGHSSFLAISSTFQGSRGGVFVHSPYWDDAMTVEGSRFAAIGERAGDQAGTAVDILDFDQDGIQDLVVGAPGADREEDGTGSLYVLPGPH